MRRPVRWYDYDSIRQKYLLWLNAGIDGCIRRNTYLIKEIHTSVQLRIFRGYSLGRIDFWKWES